MEWTLPENYMMFSAEERIQWHKKRVEQEEPIYAYLEKHGIWNCVDNSEIRERLDRIRQDRNYVEAALVIYADDHFCDLQQAMTEAVTRTQDLLQARAKILVLQFRRVCCRDHGEEQRELCGLREQTNEAIMCVEEIEKGIIQVCSQHNVEWTPFMKSHLLRR